MRHPVTRLLLLSATILTPSAAFAQKIPTVPDDVVFETGIQYANPRPARTFAQFW